MQTAAPLASAATTPTDRDTIAAAAIAISLRDGIADRFSDTVSPDPIRSRGAEHAAWDQRDGEPPGGVSDRRLGARKGPMYRDSPLSAFARGTAALDGIGAVKICNVNRLATVCT